MGLNCLVNYYGSSEPEDYGLGASLILHPTGGAIASISSNLLISPIDQENFAYYFYSELNRATRLGLTNTKLGDLYKNAHIRLQSNGLRNNQTDSFMILGDPSLSLPSAIFASSGSIDEALRSAGGCDIGHGNIPWYLGLLELFFLWVFYRVVTKPQLVLQRYRKIKK